MAAGALQWGFPAAKLAQVIALARPQRTVVARPRTVVVPVRGTPEIYFTKAIDNSRLVRVHDPARTRELRTLGVACVFLLSLMFVYAWQHFGAIEYGYRIEAQKAQRDALVEANRELRLEEAALRDPERIDVLARRMGMQPPQVGQLSRMDQPPAEPAAPILAQAGTTPDFATAR